MAFEGDRGTVPDGSAQTLGRQHVQSLRSEPALARSTVMPVIAAHAMTVAVMAGWP